MDIIIAGGTGLIGRSCVEQLLGKEPVSTIKLLSRRQLSSWQDQQKVQVLTVDFEQLPASSHDLSADVAICALGSTLKQAGSRQAFSRVDHDYVLNFANAVKAAGCQHFLVISATGANACSPFLYNKIKGIMESDLAKLGFSSLQILQPSLLLGQRDHSRALEDLGQRLAPLYSPLLPARFRPIRAEDVAAKLVRLSLAPPAGLHRYQGKQLHT